MKLLVKQSVFTLWVRCLFPSNLLVSQHCYKDLRGGGDGLNLMCCLCDVRCLSNFQQETPPPPSQINSNFLCIKGIINLHYNGICQSKGISFLKQNVHLVIHRHQLPIPLFCLIV